MQKYFFNEASTTITTVSQQQFYPLPYDYSKLKTGTITVGQLRWNPTEILSRSDWDNLNVFPYYSDIPNNYFIYGRQLGFWPIPSTGSTDATYTGLTGTLVDGNTITVGGVNGLILSFSATNIVISISSGLTLPTGVFTTSNGATGTITSTIVTAGNTITFNYQKRVIDLTLTNYITGTIAATQDSATLTGTTTAWLTNYLPSPGSVLGYNLWIQITPPLGDGAWYQIASIESDTSLTLVNSYMGLSTTGASYTIGQMPMLLEDFHDLLAYRSLMIYFTATNKDTGRADRFEKLYDLGIKRMDEYAGTKALNVNLRGAIKLINPNNYPQNVGGAPQ